MKVFLIIWAIGSVVILSWIIGYNWHYFKLWVKDKKRPDGLGNNFWLVLTVVTLLSWISILVIGIYLIYQVIYRVLNKENEEK